MDRITLIRTSLRIFACGLASLIPIVGFVPAIYAVLDGMRLGRRFRHEWNPASAYLNWGIGLALFSLGVTALAGLIVAFQLVPPFAGE